MSAEDELAPSAHLHHRGEPGVLFQNGIVTLENFVGEENFRKQISGATALFLLLDGDHGLGAAESAALEDEILQLMGEIVVFFAPKPDPAQLPRAFCKGKETALMQ